MGSPKNSEWGDSHPNIESHLRSVGAKNSEQSFFRIILECFNFIWDFCQVYQFAGLHCLMYPPKKKDGHCHALVQQLSTNSATKLGQWGGDKITHLVWLDWTYIASLFLGLVQVEIHLSGVMVFWGEVTWNSHDFQGFSSTNVRLHQPKWIFDIPMTSTWSKKKRFTPPPLRLFSEIPALPNLGFVFFFATLGWVFSEILLVKKHMLVWGKKNLLMLFSIYCIFVFINSLKE